MNALARLALILLVAAFPVGALAQEIGKGLLCDEQTQTERYVRDFTDADATIASINVEHPNACGVNWMASRAASPISVSSRPAAPGATVTGIGHSRTWTSPLSGAGCRTRWPRQRITSSRSNTVCGAAANDRIGEQAANRLLIRSSQHRKDLQGLITMQWSQRSRATAHVTSPATVIRSRIRSTNSMAAPLSGSGVEAVGCSESFMQT